jgi:hypothetical protein
MEDIYCTQLIQARYRVECYTWKHTSSLEPRHCSCQLCKASPTPSACCPSDTDCHDAAVTPPLLCKPAFDWAPVHTFCDACACPYALQDHTTLHKVALAPVMLVAAGAGQHPSECPCQDPPAAATPPLPLVCQTSLPSTSTCHSSLAAPPPCAQALQTEAPML